MRYVEKTLTLGESVLYRANIHWFIYMPTLVVVVVAFYLFIGDPIFTDDKSGEIIIGILGLMFLALPMFVNAFVTRKTTELAITTKRVIAKFGFIRRKTVELSHRQIESLAVDQSVFGRIFNFGTLTISGTGGVKTLIPNIHDPLEFRRNVLETLDQPKPA